MKDRNGIELFVGDVVRHHKRLCRIIKIESEVSVRGKYEVAVVTRGNPYRTTNTDRQNQSRYLHKLSQGELILLKLEE